MIAIERATAATDEVRHLIAELEAVLSAEYAPEQQHGLQLDALFEPHIRFFVVRLSGVAVGCGGIALLDGFAWNVSSIVRSGSLRMRITAMIEIISAVRTVGNAKPAMAV